MEQLDESISMFRRTLTDQLANLDSLIFEEDKWVRSERLINASERSEWLLARARWRAGGAILVYCASVLFLELLRSVWNGISSGAGVLKTIESDAASIYWHLFDGGGTALILGAAVVMAIFLAFSAVIRGHALFNRPSRAFSTGEGIYSSGGEAFYVLTSGCLTAIVFGIVSSRHHHAQIGSVWQVALAGGLAGICVESALDRLADAINVARNGTIQRKYRSHFDYQSRRYVRSLKWIWG